MRVNIYIVALCIVLSMSTQPVFAQTAQLSNTVQVFNETKLNIQAGTANTSSGVWTYTYDNKNDIRLKNADGSYYVNGVGPDGYIYDEQGIRVNTIEAIGKKYYEQLKNAADDEIIKFDTKTEADLFMYWFTLNHCMQQGWKYHTIDLKLGGTGIAKSEIWKHINNSEDLVVSNKVDEIVNHLPNDSSMMIKINATQRLVESCFKYDSGAMGLSMTDAIKLGKGVCFHSAKLLHLVLDKMGIQNSIAFGTIDNTTHCWIQCYVEELQKNIILDATNVSNTDAVLAYTLNPELFFSAYKEATVTG